MISRAGAIINFAISDLNMLYSSYMPFISGGALFIPSTRATNMGDEIFVVVTLPGTMDRIPVTGRVCWINHRSHGMKPSGFGIRLEGEEGRKLQQEIVKMITGQVSQDKQTYTM